jgi:hypothetical protein
LPQFLPPKFLEISILEPHTHHGILGVVLTAPTLVLEVFDDSLPTDELGHIVHVSVDGSDHQYPLTGLVGSARYLVEQGLNTEYDFTQHGSLF